jgi:hypothetical protein
VVDVAYVHARVFGSDAVCSLPDWLSLFHEGALLGVELFPTRAFFGR